DAKTAATEHASLVFLYMMVCVLMVNFSVLCGAPHKALFRSMSLLIHQDDAICKIPQIYLTFF
ncbi:hypothetical protein, partial [Alteromonas mediterranea]|uniref:hypothetical protein n=1 Tax=Alteromonas mediterranea TaxID=314275 RepID=UPI00241CDFD1